MLCHEIRKWVFAVRFCLFLIFVGTTPCLGCRNESTRVPLTGDVLVDGVRIDGEISLRPLESGAGGIATTEITQGTYQFTETNGPLPAAYTVHLEQTATGSKGASAAEVEARSWSIPRTLSSDQHRWDFIISGEQTDINEAQE